MAVLPLAVLLLGVGTVSVVVDRRLQARRQRAETTSDGESSGESIVDRTTGAVMNAWATTTGWTNRMLRRTPADLPQSFRTWAVQAAEDDPTLTDWLNGLSDQGLEAFTKHVAAFCTDMGFELSWLVEQRFDRNPDLAEAAGRVVLHYCRACQQAAMTQDDLEVFKQLLAFERNPSRRKSREFGEKVYAKLVEAGLVTATMSEYLATPRREQPQYLMNAMREAAESNSADFNRVLREVVRGEATSSSQTATSQGGTSP